MKHSKGLFFKTVVSLLLAAAVLSSGMLFIAASDETSEPLENEMLTPDVSEIIDDSNAPTEDATVAPEEKFGIYTFVSTENERVVTLYSDGQIADFASRYENGEWITLTAQEIMYLVNDTIALFDKYDTIRILSLDGEVNTYHGKSWYTSEEYLSQFGGIVAEASEASNDLRIDVYSAVLARLRVLTNAIHKDLNSTVVYTDLPASTEAWTLDCLNRYMFARSLRKDYDTVTWFELFPVLPTGALLFYQQDIYFTDNLSAEQDPCKIELPVLGDSELLSQKYDTADDTVVIIEVWEEASRSIVASLRLTSTDDAEEVAKISELWSELMYNRESIDHEEQNVLTDYRVAVYVNGVEMMYGDPDQAYASGYSRGFRYNPDGNLDVWGVTYGGGADAVFDWLFHSGSRELAEYVNSILKSRLTNE